MKAVIITDAQIGYLIKNGKFVKILRAGKYRVFGNTEIEVKSLKNWADSDRIPIQVLRNDPGFQSITDICEVPDGKIAIRYWDGRYHTFLMPGVYACFNVLWENSFELYDIDIDLADKLPSYVLEKMKSQFMEVEVPLGCKGLLYVNSKLERVLENGTYYFWDKMETMRIDVDIIDLRLTQISIQSQEILTADKATVRVNLTADYKIIDPIKMRESVVSLEEQIYTLAQLAVREYVGKLKLDEFLEGKEEIADYIYDKMKKKCEEFSVEIIGIGVKDLILPGEVRDIMKTVLLAEKKAQANVITRREEVASTRSLLNTAKMMEDNPTLYKLKELEYIERICESVGDISLSGKEDILTQLTGLLGRGDKRCS